jgi:hypothetical protein
MVERQRHDDLVTLDEALDRALAKTRFLEKSCFWMRRARQKNRVDREASWPLRDVTIVEQIPEDRLLLW